MRKLFLVLLVVGLLASGCTTTPVKIQDASDISSDRIYAFQEKTSETEASIIVIHDTGIMRSACYSAFYIDDILAARLNHGEKAIFYLVPGEHVLKMGPDPQGNGLCGWGSDFHFTNIETIIKKGETKVFNLRWMKSGVPSIQRAE